LADQSTGSTFATNPFAKVVLEPPARPWRSQRGSEQGLEYGVETMLDVARATELGVLGPEQALLNKDHVGNTTVAVVQGDRRFRVASAGAGVFGTDYVYITDRTQEGFLYLSSSLRAFVHLRRPAADQPKSKLDLTITVGDTLVVESRKCQEVLFAATSPLPLIWRLSFCGDADLRQFAYGAADILTECPPAVAQAVAVFGMPLRGELTLGNPLAAAGPSSSFAVKGLTMRPVADAEFNVPPGYADLRGRTAKESAQ
jgi:hypothetical protein